MLVSDECCVSECLDMKFASVWLVLGCRSLHFCVVFLKLLKGDFGGLKTVPKALFDKLKT